MVPNPSSTAVSGDIMEKVITTVPVLKANMPGFVVTKDKGAGNFEYHFQFTGVIDEPDPWCTLIQTLDMAKDGDDVYIYFNSVGGTVITGVAIANALLHTKANTHGVVIGICASIAAMCLCACKEIRCMPMTHVMFHSTSGGSFGKTLDCENQAANMNEYFKDLMSSVATRILTEEQINYIYATRRDLWLTAAEVNATQKKSAETPAQESESKPAEEPKNE